ncbi:unnamed protein product [Lupinus luteus]|uniref:Retrovirus-related Pol polyprotein from transposon TNT 1-94 n=1 Tax=Lupinus luteus TaxID=3873 RepID=A0AAV1YH38_LUPLU
MATDNFVQPAIPRFDGHYEHWSMLMENLLRSKEYWQVVEDGVATPEEGRELNAAQNREHDAMKLKDLRAKNFLFQAIDRSILETILCKETSKDIWDSMKKKYQGSSRVKRAQLQALRRDFETLKMKESESVTDYCSRVMGIANSMRIHGEKMGDTLIVEKILRSLTPKFDYVVCSIEESNDTDELSLDELQSSLLVHEQKMHRSSRVEEQALKASTNTHSNNFRGRGRGRGRGYGAIWLRKILEELHFKKDDATIIYCDNTSAIKLSKNPVLHGRSKHIDVKYYCLRDLNNDGTIVLKYCRSEDQLADIFTKPLKAPSFQNLRNLLGVCMMQQQS